MPKSLKTKFIWLNGKFVSWEKCKIHLLNHSLHYGSAVFEGVRFYETKKGPAVFRLEEHLSRLFFSAKTMGMKITYPKKQLFDAVLELIKKNNLKSGYLRPIIFYGHKMGLNPTDADLNVALSCWEWGKYFKKETVKVKISSFIRIHSKSSIMGAKISGHYFNSILTTLEAKNAGFDEALLLDYKGNIAEGPGENIFFVKNKKLYTPPLGSILPGITRDTVMKIAKDLGYKVLEKNFKPKDLKKINESFFTGTAVEICPISKIDNKKIGNGEVGEITREIKEIYKRTVNGEEKKYLKWLTFLRI